MHSNERRNRLNSRFYMSCGDMSVIKDGIYLYMDSLPKEAIKVESMDQLEQLVPEMRSEQQGNVLVILRQMSNHPIMYMVDYIIKPQTAIVEDSIRNNTLWALPQIQVEYTFNLK